MDLLGSAMRFGTVAPRRPLVGASGPRDELGAAAVLVDAARDAGPPFDDRSAHVTPRTAARGAFLGGVSGRGREGRRRTASANSGSHPGDQPSLGHLLAQALEHAADLVQR